MQKPAKEINPAAVARLLKIRQRKAGHPYPAKWWGADNGRHLENYRRIHTFLLATFGKKGLAGKRIVHLGAGNARYVSFLKKHCGAHALAIDINRIYTQEAKDLKVEAPYVVADAKNLPVKPESQDIIISDRFLFSQYEHVTGDDGTILGEAYRALKPGGIIVLERVTTREVLAGIHPLKEHLESVPLPAPVTAHHGADLQKAFFVYRKKQ